MRLLDRLPCVPGRHRMRVACGLIEIGTRLQHRCVWNVVVARASFSVARPRASVFSSSWPVYGPRPLATRPARPKHIPIDCPCGVGGLGMGLSPGRGGEPGGHRSMRGQGARSYYDGKSCLLGSILRKDPKPPVLVPQPPHPSSASLAPHASTGGSIPTAGRGLSSRLKKGGAQHAHRPVRRQPA
jgi:hypothetical protein